MRIKKAITTKYYPPTATRSACIRATDNDGNTVRIGYDEMTNHEFGEPRHRAAAVALSVKMGWPIDNLVAGALGGTGNYVFVEAPQPAAEVKRGKPACIHLFNGGEGAAAGVRVHQTGIDSFTVLYGLQERKGLNYADAAHEFGECVFHALACEGKLDNRERDE